MDQAETSFFFPPSLINPSFPFNYHVVVMEGGHRQYAKPFSFFPLFSRTFLFFFPADLPCIKKEPQVFHFPLFL